VLTDDESGLLTLATSLSWDQLAALEQARAGNDLELRVDVHATLAGGAIDPPEHYREEAFSLASAASHADSSYRFSRADALALVGAAAGLLGRLH
jgi:hypothetical protein